MDKPVYIRLTDDFTSPAIEELERRDFKTDMLYIMVFIPLVVVSITCIVLSFVLQQMWLGLVGILLWVVSIAASVLWLKTKENIYSKIWEAESELLEQMVKEKENSK